MIFSEIILLEVKYGACYFRQSSSHFFKIKCLHKQLKKLFITLVGLLMNGDHEVKSNCVLLRLEYLNRARTGLRSGRTQWKLHYKCTGKLVE